MNLAEEYIGRRDPGSAAIMSRLREIILKSSPAIVESLKYGIPYYSYHRGLCYISPTKGGVNLGFTKGAILSNANAALSGDGKQVRHIFIPNGSNIPEREILETLYEAMILNDPSK